MGWFYSEAKYVKSGKVDIVKEVVREDTDVVAEAVDNIVYAAVKEVDGDKERVVAFVIHTDVYKKGNTYEFGEKPIHEEEGPAEAKCPESILKLLTPTDSDLANDWRERCWKYNRS